jgi:hypothetical protein
MHYTNQLKDTLSQYFTFNKSRLECFSLLILALIKVRNVNLSELSQGFNGEAKLKSKYRRIQRFFDKADINISMLSMFIFKLFGVFNKCVYLAMDRTNWKFGKKNINILLVSIICGSYAVPIYWILLDKRGNSNHKERKLLFEALLKIIDKSHIAGILADREFIGKKWFDYLLSRDLPFFIRIKKDLKVEAFKVQLRTDLLFLDLKESGQKKEFKNILLSGIYVNLSATVNDKGELMIIATNTDSNNIIETYRQRWKIETMFGFFKTKGFNFESTHLTDMEKISKMIIVIAIAYSWSIKIGEWKNSIEPIKIKKHGRKEISIFRYGLDCIREIILCVNSKTKKNILAFIKMLSINTKQVSGY